MNPEAIYNLCLVSKTVLQGSMSKSRSYVRGKIKTEKEEKFLL